MVPMIGVVMVNRKTSMVGDALSHTALAGVGVGLIMGIDPILGAIMVAILSVLSIEKIRETFPQHGDMATAIANFSKIDREIGNLKFIIYLHS